MSERAKGSSPYAADFQARFDHLIRSVGGYVAARDITGVAETTLRAWRDGNARLPFEAARRLSVASGLSLDWLAGGEQHPAQLREGLNPVMLHGRRPSFWADVPVRDLLISMHRQTTLEEALAICRKRFGDERTPSRSALGRLWLGMDHGRRVRVVAPPVPRKTA
jgi:hypothetical protein